MRKFFALLVLFATGALLAPMSAEAELYECTCVNVAVQDCDEGAAIEQKTGFTVEVGSEPADDNPPSCQAKCASPGALCTACTKCLSSCQPPTGGKVCQLWWSKKASDPGPSTSGGQTGGVVTLKNPLNVSTVPELINNILRTAIGIVGALALLVFVYGGFLWLTSRGEAAKVSAGKEAMKWAAIGLVVIFTSYALVRFVFSTITG